MRSRQISFETVRKIGLELPDVEEATMYGAPALKVRGKFLACMASHKSAEPNTLVVRIDFDDRDALIADDPRTYYLKPHYQDYPSVLVRLSVIQPEALQDLLRSAWRSITGSSTQKRRGRTAVADANTSRRKARRPG